MKKSIFLLFLFLISLLGSLCITNVCSSSKYTKKTIVVVGGKGYPPFNFLGSQGNVRGIFVDIWKLWSKKTNVNVKFKLVNWKDALEKVKNGEYDAISGLFYSKERDRYFDFTNPYMELDTRIFFNKKIFGIESIDDLIGFKVGIVKGDYIEDFLRKHYPEISVKTYLKSEQMIKDAIDGNIKVFIYDTIPALYILSKYRKGDDFKYSTNPIYTQKVYSAVKEGNKELLNLINDGFKKISKKEIQDIVKKWTGLSVYFMWKKYIILGFVILSSLTLVFLVWSFSLKKAVNIKTKELIEKNKEITKLYNRLNTITKTANMGYVERDLNGHVIDVNDEYLKLIGRTRDEVIGKKIDEWTHPKDRCKQEKAREIVLKKGYLSGFEVRYIRPDNTFVYVIANTARLKEELDRAVFLCQDITRIKEQEREIRALAKELEITLNSIGDGVISTDRNGKIRFFNPVAENITGWKKEEVIGKDLPEIFHILSEKTEERIEDPYTIIKRTKRIIGLGNHTLLVRKNGERIPILDSGAPIFGEDGDILGVVIVFRDGREQRTREQELLRLERLNTISNISAGIAHDFNNLIAAIISNLSLVKRRFSLKKEEKKIVDRIERAAIEARNLTKQLMLLGKEFHPEKRAVDYRKKLKEMTRFILAGTSVASEFHIDRDLLPIYCEETQVDQVIQNILINAKDAMVKGGKISISAKNVVIREGEAKKLSPGEYVLLSIKDQGIGIDKDKLDKIFDPYYSTKKGGTGLGLYVVKNIVENHDGHIEIFSEKNIGTEVRIYLPSTREESKETPHHEEEVYLKGVNILFMDDEDMFREVMGELIPNIGGRVMTATNGEQAISYYVNSMKNNDKFDVVVLDITIIGGEGGIEVGKKILEIDRDAKIIISSGHTAHPIFKDYKKYGFKGAIKKPYTIYEFTSYINDILYSDDI